MVLPADRRPPRSRPSAIWAALTLLGLMIALAAAYQSGMITLPPDAGTTDSPSGEDGGESDPSWPVIVPGERGPVDPPVVSSGPLPEIRPAGSEPAGESGTARRTDPGGGTAGVVVPGQTIRDREGEVIWQGDVDLTETLARIDSGRRLFRFRNDGSVFQNRERRLPRGPAGTYREWVHPTPGEGGPGPQRVVTGGGRDAWYTPDHYRTFRKIR